MKGLVSSPSASPQPLLFFSHRRHDSRIIIPTCQSRISVLKTHQHQHRHQHPHQHQHRPTTFICLSSLSSSSSSVVEQKQDPLPLPSPPPAIDSVDVHDHPDALPISASGCKGCGREQVERGCNGEGRMQGGIATIPGFGWWPIKAFRPCPRFVASGGSYRRRGQSMDEVAFGGSKRGSSTNDFDELGKRKKGKEQRRGKR